MGAGLVSKFAIGGNSSGSASGPYKATTGGLKISRLCLYKAYLFCLCVSKSKIHRTCLNRMKSRSSKDIFVQISFGRPWLTGRAVKIT